MKQAYSPHKKKKIWTVLLLLIIAFTPATCTATELNHQKPKRKPGCYKTVYKVANNFETDSISKKEHLQKVVVDFEETESFLTEQTRINFVFPNDKFPKNQKDPLDSVFNYRIGEKAAFLKEHAGAIIIE
ncbi:MAG: hypothetical protein ACPGC9_01940, partial [Cytophagales bacterium]